MDPTHFLIAAFSFTPVITSADAIDSAISVENTRPQERKEGDSRHIFSWDLNDQPAGKYTSSQLINTFSLVDNYHFGIEQERLELVEETAQLTAQNRYVRIHFPEGELGSQSSGVHFRHLLTSKKSQYGEQICLNYRFFFEPGFSMKGMGKMFGLSSKKGASGGSPRPDGYNGFSVRPEWQPAKPTLNKLAGRIALLTYHPAQQHDGKGDKFFFKENGDEIYLSIARWYHMEICMIPNTVDEKGVHHNGRLSAYLDGHRMVYKTNMVFRYTEKLKLDSLFFSSFYGGSRNEYRPENDEYIRIADVQATQAPVTAK